MFTYLFVCSQHSLLRSTVTHVSFINWCETFCKLHFAAEKCDLSGSHFIFTSYSYASELNTKMYMVKAHEKAVDHGAVPIECQSFPFHVIGPTYPVTSCCVMPGTLFQAAEETNSLIYKPRLL